MKCQISSLEDFWIVIWNFECYISPLKWHIYWKLHCSLQQILVYTKRPLARDSLGETKQNYTLVARGPVSPEYCLSYKPHVCLWYPLHHWKKPNVCNLGNGCNFCYESTSQREIVMVASCSWSVGLKIGLLNKNIVRPSSLSRVLILLIVLLHGGTSSSLFSSYFYAVSFFPFLHIGKSHLKGFPLKGL